MSKKVAVNIKQNKSGFAFSRIKSWAEKLRLANGGGVGEWEEIKPKDAKDGEGISCKLAYLRHPCRIDCDKTYPVFVLSTTLKTSFNQTLTAMSNPKRAHEYNRIMMEGSMEELENRGGTCKVIKAQTKKILLLSPKKFVTAVERRWIVNDDGSRTYCLIHQGLEDQPFVPGGCSGVALGGCLWLEPLEKGEQCKITMVFGLDLKIPSFIQTQVIGMVGHTYPFKFVRELSIAASKTPSGEDPSLTTTGFSHIGFMAYFSEKDINDSDGYETDDEEWEDDRSPTRRMTHKKILTRGVNGLRRQTKALKKKIPAPSTMVSPITNPNSNAMMDGIKKIGRKTKSALLLRDTRDSSK